jgi:lipopolysaccharide/colanic/teichoic acid biosynthesis glycosyltransferase
MKRTFDIVVALTGLLVLSPVLLLIAFAIWIEDRQSPFFVGQRVARGGGRFGMVKFRSMVPNAWKTGVSSTSAGDRRITRVGALIRRAKLDEFPQLWNVLKGDMSLVGPRPQVETDANMYTDEERRMLTVRPGITDLASIVFADEGEILAGAEDPDLRYNQIIRPWKSRLALLYVDRRNFGLDLRLIALTLGSAVSRPWALEEVSRILAAEDLDPMLRRMVQRREPLVAWPPPGAPEIVQRYPSQSAHA